MDRGRGRRLVFRSQNPCKADTMIGRSEAKLKSAANGSFNPDLTTAGSLTVVERHTGHQSALLVRHRHGRTTIAELVLRLPYAGAVLRLTRQIIPLEEELMSACEVDHLDVALVAQWPQEQGKTENFVVGDNVLLRELFTIAQDLLRHVVARDHLMDMAGLRFAKGNRSQISIRAFDTVHHQGLADM